MKQKCNLKLTFRTVSRAVLVFVALMAVQAMSAQNKNITLNVKDVPLESVLNTLKSDYGYSFVMITNDIDINRKITLNIKDSPIESVLSALFEGRNVKFEVDDNKILISRAAAAPKTFG
jgi:type II secretory pathway component GspD/PulD (secretin)